MSRAGESWAAFIIFVVVAAVSVAGGYFGGWPGVGVQVGAWAVWYAVAAMVAR